MDFKIANTKKLHCLNLSGKDNLIKYYFFPVDVTFPFFEEKNVLEKNNLDIFFFFLENKNEIKENIEKQNINLVEHYKREKEEIKKQNYELVSSFIYLNLDKNLFNEIESFLLKNNLDSFFFFDYFLYNKISVFVKKDLLRNDISFILKNINIFNLLNHKSVLKYKNIKIIPFSNFKNFNNLSLKEQNDFRFFMREKIKKMKLEGEIFLLNDCLFSVDEKRLSYFLLSL